jgi:addiction module HigA family antidote
MKPEGNDMAKRVPLPGQILREAFMEPRALSANRLAKALAVPPFRIAGILAGRRAIRSDTALRIARYLGTSPEFWMSLQMAYDLEVARRQTGRAITATVRPHKRTN